MHGMLQLFVILFSIPLLESRRRSGSGSWHLSTVNPGEYGFADKINNTCHYTTSVSDDMETDYSNNIALLKDIIFDLNSELVSRKIQGEQNCRAQGPGPGQDNSPTDPRACP